MKLPLLSLLACLATLTLCSCIEGEEEIRVHADGSGRATYRLEAPNLLFKRIGNLDDILERARDYSTNSDNLTIHSLNAQTRGARTTVEVDLSFGNLRKVDGFLSSFRDPEDPATKSEIEIIIGEIDMDISFPTYSYYREIDLSPLLTDGALPIGGKAMLGDSAINYTMHLPAAPTHHDADSVSPDGRTLRWSFPVAEMASGPVSMSFEAPLPLPWRKIFLLVISVLLLLCLLPFIRKKKLKTSRPHVRPNHP
ncbi:MAG: hypothetical protein Q7Q71_05655 [Verrucomicrobiota bacterium JB023]|nr:hypothetical protein [Verrucomicrobiota bacterium JB023]